MVSYKTKYLTHRLYLAIRHKIILLVAVLLTLTGCTDTFDAIPGGEMEQGDPVLFTTFVPDVRPSTRSAKEDWQTELASYKAVDRDYVFHIEMWKKGDTPTKIGESTYQPDPESNDGTLAPILPSPQGTSLYWQDNVSKWGFRATAGTETLSTDQTDQEKWLAQDRLIGYSYLPIWKDGEGDGDGAATDDFNSINYRTSKQWYADNQRAKEQSGLMVESNEDYKKIPLYLQHQRSWITIILKAGEGVTREALAYATSAENIQTTIYSYPNQSTAPIEINAWANEEFINYDNDKNGPAATGLSTTRYDAIVEPHNFNETKEKQESDVIARINVSNQKFTFAAANDYNYANSIASGESQEVLDAREAMKVYNLQPGKHLTIIATLTRASRMIMITAWIEDWTETVTQTICDDYGQNGDPVEIHNKQELIDFLTDTEKNKAGNVGLIVPNALSLTDDDWDGSDYNLKATLNLAGCKLSIRQQLLNSIARTGSIINGEVKVADAFSDPSAIANTNYGTVERVRVTTSGDLTTARASKAGIIDRNYGTIYQCSSSLPVYGTSGYVGGIAAQSLFLSGDNVSPIVDACTVLARVDGSEDIIAGGGIVGEAEGRVSNNTFEYGVTLLQMTTGKYYNIIAAIGNSTQGLTNHTNNSWPTTARYTVKNTEVEIVNNSSLRLDAVIDSRDELKTLLTSGYNQAGQKYRVANSFSIDKENWIWGDDVLKDTYFATDVTDGYAHGTVKFKLDGNNKTITLTGDTRATMLFGCIIGEVHDLQLELEKPIVADRIQSDKNDDSNTDAIAAFAYAVTTAGEAKGQIRNITLRAADDAYIESTTPAGIAVWAMNGGTLINCASNAPVRMHVTIDGVDARHYAGGIVACAEHATITQCKYYNDNGVGWAPGTDAPKAQKSNCRYGGIVGGTSEIPNSFTTPNLTISDCYSWWNLPKFGQDVLTRPYMGGLIGSTVYHDNQDVFSAMADNNAGNWWTGTTGAGYMASGVAEEKAIGKKNSVAPVKPQGW